MPPMCVAFEMWKYTAREPCTGWVRTIGCSIGVPYLSSSSGRVSAWPSRPLKVVSDSRRRRSSSGSAAYAARMLATLVPPPADGISTPYRMVAAGGRSRLV